MRDKEMSFPIVSKKINEEACRN